VSAETEIASDDPTITISRVYDAPRELVWSAMTEAQHVRRGWGGPGFSNPVCEMDVRPDGLWNHVMRFPDGRELHMSFVFLEVERPARLVWRNADHGRRKDGLPEAVITVTLQKMGNRTMWRMVARFRTLAERDAAISLGFGKPIEASSDRLVEYLKRIWRSDESQEADNALDDV
jgi:uncharacterized protein YndB with AHSA1/START domain